MNHSTELFGVLAINKPAGKTSRDVVNIVQRLVRPTKIGHTGTLDPLATGVLLLVIGKATRLVEYAHSQPKSYQADFLLGQSSDTLDIDGQVLSLPEAPMICREAWLAEMQTWQGRIRQTPPRYSACHIDGHRAHDLARQGVEFELASREVTVYQSNLLEFSYPKVVMSIQCSSGTYIRSLGHDIAVALGTDAVMSRLVRTAIGSYGIASCVELDQLTSLADVRQAIRSPIGLVDQFPQINVSDDECERLRTGSTLEINEQRETAFKECIQFGLGSAAIANGPPPIAAIDGQGRLVAIVEIRGNELQPTRVFL